MIVTLDLDNYLNSVLNNYYFKNIIWHWIVDLKNENVTLNINSDDVVISQLEEIYKSLTLNRKDFIKHNGNNSDNKFLFSPYRAVIVFVSNYPGHDALGYDIQLLRSKTCNKSFFVFYRFHACCRAG